MEKTKKFIPFAYYVLILLSTITVLWRDLGVLLQTFAATGIDGYYYVLQINTFHNEGHLYFSTYTPLNIYLLTVVGYLVSDTVLAIKISAVILHLLMSFGIMLLIADISKSRWFGLCGFLIASFSGLHYYFIAEFLNNLTGLMFLVWSVWFILKLGLGKFRYK